MLRHDNSVLRNESQASRAVQSEAGFDIFDLDLEGEAYLGKCPRWLTTIWRGHGQFAKQVVLGEAGDRPTQEQSSKEGDLD